MVSTCFGSGQCFRGVVDCLVTFVEPEREPSGEEGCVADEIAVVACFAILDRFAEFADGRPCVLRCLLFCGPERCMKCPARRDLCAITRGGLPNGDRVNQIGGALR